MSWVFMHKQLWFLHQDQWLFDGPLHLLYCPWSWTMSPPRHAITCIFIAGLCFFIIIFVSKFHAYEGLSYMKATFLIMIYTTFCIPLVVDRSQSRIPICLKFVLTNLLASNTRSLSSSHVIIIAWRRAIVLFTVTDARLVSSDHSINISVCHTSWLFLCRVFFSWGYTVFILLLLARDQFLQKL